MTTDEHRGHDPETPVEFYSSEHRTERHLAHSKWARRWGVATGLGIFIVFGWVWVPFTAWLAYKHAKAAREWDPSEGDD